jgi:hypothetical protein
MEAAWQKIRGSKTYLPTYLPTHLFVINSQHLLGVEYLSLTCKILSPLVSLKETACLKNDKNKFLWVFIYLSMQSDASWLGSLIATVIGNLKLSITNIHIRYEDTER